MWQKSLLKNSLQLVPQLHEVYRRTFQTEASLTASEGCPAQCPASPRAGCSPTPAALRKHFPLHCSAELCTADYSRLLFTGTTDNKHTLVVCLPLQATGFIGKIHISPLHHGLFHHFEIPTGEWVQPTQVKSLTLNLLMYHTWEPATRQGILTPRTTAGMYNSLFLPLIVQGRKIYSITIIHFMNL